MQAKISVVIPVYNVEKYLRKCLDSVRNQTLKEIEIICVDDASTDSSFDILQEYQKKDSRIKTIHFPLNMGIYIVRKRGVEAASGQYIMFLDSDDMFSLNACERAFQIIESRQVDVVHFATRLFPAKGTPLKAIRGIKKFLPPYSGRLDGEKIFLYSFGKKKMINHHLSNKIFRSALCKQAYKAMDDFYLNVAEDLLVWFVISFLANNYFGCKSEYLYHYNFGVGICGGLFNSITDSQFHNFCRTAQILPHLAKFLSEQNVVLEYDQILSRINEEQFTNCLEKFLLMDSPQKWEDIFAQYWFHGDKLLLRNFIIRENSIKKYEQSLSLRFGLFLTWIPRKILSLITGREY